MKKILAALTSVLLCSGLGGEMIACGATDTNVSTQTINLAQATSDGKSIILYLNPDKTITDANKVSVTINNKLLPDSDLQFFNDNKRVRLVNEIISVDTQATINYNNEGSIKIDTGEIPYETGSILYANISRNGKQIVLTMKFADEAVNDDFYVRVNDELVEHTYNPATATLTLLKNLQVSDVVSIQYQNEIKLVLDTTGIVTPTIASAIFNETGQIIDLAFTKEINPVRDDFKILINGEISAFFYASGAKEIFLPEQVKPSDTCEIMYQSDDSYPVDLSNINPNSSKALVGGIFNNSNKSLGLIVNPNVTFNYNNLIVKVNDVQTTDYTINSLTKSLRFNFAIKSTDKVTLEYGGDIFTVDTTRVPDTVSPTIISATIDEQGQMVTLSLKSGVTIKKEDLIITLDGRELISWELQSNNQTIMLTNNVVQKGQDLSIQYLDEDAIMVNTWSVNPKEAPSIESGYINNVGDVVTLIFKSGATATQSDLSIMNNDVTVNPNDYQYDTNKNQITFNTSILKNDNLFIIYKSELGVQIDTSVIYTFDPTITGASINSDGRTINLNLKQFSTIAKTDLILEINGVIENDYTLWSSLARIILYNPIAKDDVLTIKYKKDPTIKIVTGGILYKTIKNAQVSSNGVTITLTFSVEKPILASDLKISWNNNDLTSFTYNDTTKQITIDTADFRPLRNTDSIFILYQNETPFYLDTTLIK